MPRLAAFLLLSVLLPLSAFDLGQWQATGAQPAATPMRGGCRLVLPDGAVPKAPATLEMDDGVARIQRPRPQLVLARRFPVRPNTVYLLKLTARSANSVVVRCGARAMAYSTPGEAQILCDLVKSGPAKELEVRIELGGLPGESIYDLSGFEFRTPKLAAEVPARPVLGETLLDEKSAIIHPEGFEEDARALQAAIRERCGLALRIVPEAEAVHADRPELRDEWKRRHLILLGNLNNNRALWAAYGKFLAAADGYYPGAGGHVLRTAADVFGNGRNHLILGGSDDAGVRAAIAAFRKRLAGPKIPFLLEVELGGECRRAFDADERLWATNPAAAGPRLLEPGYGKVVRWYVNVMGYYWSGRESYRARARQYLKELLKDRAYTHHYILEFFVRAYDMVDHSPLFTAAERRQIDALLKQNFLDFGITDLTWMPGYNRPYELHVILNRHVIAPLMADHANAEFLLRSIPLSPDEAAIARYRHAEKDAFLRHWSATTFNPSLPRSIPVEQEEALASLVRYALANERFETFTSGNARHLLRLWEMSPARPLTRDDRFLAGVLACYYRDPGFTWLQRHLPTVKEHFQMRYLCGVHRYAPAPDAPEAEPREWHGVFRTRWQPQDILLWNGLKFKRHRSPDFPAREGAEAIVFRNGGDYLRLSAFGETTGAITEFYHDGRPLFQHSSSSTFGLGRANYYDYNAVSIQRLDRLDDDPQPYAGAARVESFEPADWSASIAIRPFAGCAWQRSVAFTGKPGCILVRDRITALEAGDYLIQIGWRPQGIPSFDGRVWTGLNGNLRFHVTSLGEGFRVVENLADYQRKKAPFPEYHHVARRRLAPGEGVTAYTLLETTENAAPTRFELGEDGRLRIGGDDHCQFTVDGRLVDTDPEKTFRPLTVASAAVAPATPEAPRLRPVRRNGALQLPGRLGFTVQTVGGARVVDFGRVVALSEIRNARSLRFWAELPLPADLEYSADGKVFRKIASERRWLPGVRTANYGQADPRERSHQTTFPDVQARYVRGTDATLLTYYSADTPAARSTLEIVPAGDGFLVQSAVFPRYLRDRRSEDYLFAMLDRDFGLRYAWRSPAVVQDSKFLSWPDATPRLVVITDDAKIRVLDERGQVARVIDLYRLQADFHHQYGKPNTRQPLGGFTLPFSLGVWRPSPKEAPLLVVGRYCYYSFVRPDGTLAGLLQSGEYCLGALLDRGVRDSGGNEALYGLGRFNLTRLFGPADPRRVQNCPVIYHNENVRLPSYGGSVEGDRTLAFKPVGDGLLAIARESFLGVFDTRARAWRFAWSAPVGLDALCLAGERTIVAASPDRILRRITFAPDWKTVAKCRSIQLPSTARNLRHYHGRTLVATADGLYELQGDDSLRLLVAGDCRDAALNREGKLLALLDNGELLLCEEAAP